MDLHACSDESSTEIVADTATTGEEINRLDERLTVEKKMISQTDPRSLFEFKRVHLYGVTSICGRRPEMEDVVSTIPSFLQSPTNSLIDGRFSSQSTAHVFGVCNGHGGSQKESCNAGDADDVNQRKKGLKLRNAACEKQQEEIQSTKDLIARRGADANFGSATTAEKKLEKLQEQKLREKLFQPDHT
ncbi:PREDICTED: protein phosphatase 2C 56-like [Brassica oleracea var. oleracea]|uniref:protein phosphatase 2C 56-like n=1 Tax=Brassica oleracea var. oleracea TaxID=109376 RepID=UPI0006A6D6FB|nr:PREDICTED: protein phosphatase 2C 56-like [Brassica oleracea var. oleracea]